MVFTKCKTSYKFSNIIFQDKIILANKPINNYQCVGLFHLTNPITHLPLSQILLRESWRTESSDYYPHTKLL